MNQYTLKNRFGLIYIVMADNETAAIIAAQARDMISGLPASDYKFL